MLIVAALGGNALLRRGQPMTMENQQANVATAVKSLAEIVKSGHQLVLTHGNGPQVGLIALQAAAGPTDGAYPLDVLGAESEGMIGYLLQQGIASELGPSFPIATLLTQTVVAGDDPGFKDPTKPIGPQYTDADIAFLAQERGWRFVQEGSKWRRVVASPQPECIIETGIIALLVANGVLVICAGGGGIPVIRHGDGRLSGIEAVVDKDLASALLAQKLNADLLLLLTDVDGVYIGLDSDTPQRLSEVIAGTLDVMQFSAGSMRPKVQAALDFGGLEGRRAAIGSLGQAMELLAGTAGTQFVPPSPKIS